MVDTSDAIFERVSVSNKLSRSQAISRAIEQLLQERQPSLVSFLRCSDAFNSLRHRCSERWAGSPYMINLERSPAAQVSLTSQHLEALMLRKDRFLSGPPRSVSATQASKPSVIFTEGCFEPGSDVPAGVGGVMFCPTPFGSVQVRAFGAVVPAPLLDAWHENGKRHLRGQVEMYAVLLARSCWAGILDG